MIETTPGQRRFLVQAAKVLLLLVCLFILFLLLRTGRSMWQDKVRNDAIAALPKTYRIQLIHFSIEPKKGYPDNEQAVRKPGGVYNALALPGYLGTIGYATNPLPLTLDDPKAFIAHLQKQMPEHTVRLWYSAVCDSDASGNCEVLGGPNKKDPEQYQSRDLFHIRPTAPNQYTGKLDSGIRWFNFREGHMAGDPLPTLDPHNLGFPAELPIRKTQWLFIHPPQNVGGHWVRSITAVCLTPRPKS